MSLLKVDLSLSLSVPLMSFEVPGVRGSAGHRMSPTVLLLPLNHWLPETGNTCLLLTANQWSIKRPVRRCAAGAPPARPFDWRGRGGRRLCIIDQEVASRALWFVGDEKRWLIKWIRPPSPPPPHTPTSPHPTPSRGPGTLMWLFGKKKEQTNSTSD